MRLVVTLSLILVVFGSGCGGTDSSGDDSAVDDEAEVRDAVSAYVAAFGDGDPDAAWALVSGRCQRSTPESEYRAAVAAAGELYADLEVDEFSEIVLDDDTAVVFYSTSPVVEDSTDGERWIRDGGGWRWDDC